MAGNYPDVPGPRIAFDRDGSVGFYINAVGAISVRSHAQREAGNDETSSSVFASQGNTASNDLLQAGVVFVVPHDLVGIHFHRDTAGGTALVETSVNTTNGQDGTWVNRGSANDLNSINDKRAMRDDIHAVDWPGTIGVRIGFWGGPGTQNFRTLHLYGAPAAGEVPNRLRAWHPTLDEEVGGAYMDWGDVARNTELFKEFRVKNPSATLTATSVSVTSEALTDTTPANAAMHQFSDDGGATFDTSLLLGNLGPGEVSDVITVRRDTPAGAELSVWWTRIVAAASSWT